MNKQIAIIGLGKMGGGLALNLKDKGYEVFGYNRTSSVTEEYKEKGIEGIYDLKEILEKIEAPRIVWMMLPAGDATSAMISELSNILEVGDIVIEGGNSFFKDDIKNSNIVTAKGIKYIDVGVSGGPAGARNGACLMIGGDVETFNYLEDIFRDVSIKNGYKFFEGIGAGHFVKMVHNGIEYGMMQSIAEGFNIFKNAPFKFNLLDIADIYSNGSVIESRLVSWLKEGYEKYGDDLESIKGEVDMLGEGEWTVKTAKEMNLPVPVIEDSIKFRIDSKKNPSYTGKVLSMLRNMFGGHKA